MQRSDIHSFVFSQKAEIVNTLKTFVKIPSFRGTPRTNAPFGEACKAALEFSEKLYRENGFETTLNYSGGYMLAEHGSGEKTIGLFAHSDVVAPGDGWMFTQPFDPVEKGGYLIGRGTLDDKSAVVEAIELVTMMILRCDEILNE